MNVQEYIVYKVSIYTHIHILSVYSQKCIYSSVCLSIDNPEDRDWKRKLEI